WIFLVPLDFFALGGQFRSLSKEKDNRYAKSRITGMDVGLAVERMEQVLISGELLKDATLRLPDLARALDMAPYQLSELLNNALRKSFREYVNGLRVKAVQDALRHNPDADIGSVMRENGFRSRSVFNQAFKIQTGETPFHFKRSLRK
ncbi:MAG TPA: helix-turn-helix domain-containing protein, partial [Leptospiraceae bacterium]|nr:helix-turn-helix domain-containing protein [Leptospiraceae bacterium]